MSSQVSMTSPQVVPINPLTVSTEGNEKSGSVEQKYEKHLKNSEPILANVLTPFQAFKNGMEKAIASFIKLGQEGQVKNKIVSVPQAKSEETTLLEQLIKNILSDFDSVRFIEKNDRYLAISGGKIYQFSHLLERANFNHMQLSKEELGQYHSLLDGHQLYHKPYLNSVYGRPTDEDFNKLDKEGLCQNLCLAEKEAINVYTGNYYRVMNSLLRGEVQDALKYASTHQPPMMKVEAKTNQALKEALIHIVVAVTALNKLPDYSPEAGEDGKIPKYLYRAESYLPENVLKKRKWAVLQGGGITTETGFLSTAYLKPASAFFSEFTTAGVMIKNLKGKKITPLSQFGSVEREILLPPTQMQWLYQKEIITDVFQKNMTLFIAKPVTVSPELTLDHRSEMPDWLVKTIDSSDEHLALV